MYPSKMLVSRLSLGLACLVFAASASAQAAKAPAEPLTVTLMLKRVQADAGGKEQLVNAPSVKPGELVEYQALYANKGAKSLGNVQATLPLPEGMDYQGQSARPMPVLASTDGKTFAAEPLMRTVKDKDGKSVTEQVPYAQYRALRWQIKLVEPGKDFTVKARARVAQAAPAPAVLPVPKGGAK
ncbi:MAG: hypothetical protein M3R45_10980 [Pseudomonadota bacterium]|nr:hypothetical protein [Pseudomonadota bacterium]